MIETFTRLLVRGGYRCWSGLATVALLFLIGSAPAFAQQYCSAGGGEFGTCSTANSDEFIVRVSLNGVDNVTGCTPFIPDSGYTDYSDSLTFSVQTCSSYPIEIENAASIWTSDAGKVWVDWNNDFDFDDAGEFIGSQTGPGPVYTITLSVPGTVATGDYRMRVRIDYNTPGNNPCGFTGYGEVEDYKLSVTNAGGCLCTGPVQSTQTLSTAAFTWAPISSAVSYNIRYKAVADPNTVPTWATPTNVTDTTYTILDLDTCTSYEFQIQVVCAGGDTSAYSASYLFATFCCFDPLPLANYIENENCGTDVNGGCNTTNVFEAINGGDTVAGTAWYDGNFTMDMDWYEITVSQDTFLQVNLKAAFASQLTIYDVAAGCFSAPLVQGFSATACDTFSAGLNVAAGSYWIVVQPQFNFGISNNCGEGSNAYLLGVVFAAPLPGPANDDCDSAIVLLQDTTCVYQTFDVNAASQSQFGCAGTANDDVWFSFVATTAEPVISVVGSTGFDAVFEVFDACG
ncbi:MAG TPA: GEVED domain-containing protein, partial [Chitinophagales bacterium]|nr:GEVED domain-containing protein [Chitinophagales bacterium]